MSLCNAYSPPFVSSVFALGGQKSSKALFYVFIYSVCGMGDKTKRFPVLETIFLLLPWLLFLLCCART